MMKISCLNSKIILQTWLFAFFTMVLSCNDIHAQSIDSYSLSTSGSRQTSATLVYHDTMIVLSDLDFEIPVTMSPGADISAITIGFYFPPEYIEITGLELADSTIGYYFNVTDSLFVMSWADINPIVLTDNDTVLILKMKTLDLSGLVGTIRLGLYESTEFADQNANIIEGVKLEIPEIELFRPDTVDTITGYYAHVYPNPFDNYATLYFGLSEESEVKVLIYNTEGILMREMGEKTYPAGDHEVKLDGLDFAKGVYFLKFVMRNPEGKKEEMFKIMSIR
jgi:hypothetical protein